jgi:hypothetical protein
MQRLLSRDIDDVIRGRHDVADGADHRLVIHSPTKRNNLCNTFPLPYWIESPPAVRSHVLRTTDVRHTYGVLGTLRWLGG